MDNNELVILELRVHGVVAENGKFSIGERSMNARQAIRYFKDRAEDNKKFLARLWKEIAIDLGKLAGSGGTDDLSNLFLSAMRSLRDHAEDFGAGMEEIKAAVINASMADINSFGRSLMSKVIDYRNAIEWVMHLIRKDLYLAFLVSKASAMGNKQRMSTAQSAVPGAYSNLDLPMQERVFEWADIDEEVRETTRSKQQQRRYKGGLEGIGNQGPNEGYYWRELRNEPFLWGDEDENPYPHRTTLWSS